MGIVAKYKYDGSVYADLIPEFNAEFTDYTVIDEVDSENSNHIIRTIESDSLPTLMRFGSNLNTYVEGSELALLEILDMNTSGLTSCYRMFRYCINLTSITCGWDTSNVTTMYAMFANCQSLTSLDVSNFNTSNVTSMYSMFYYCQSLTTLDVSNFNTSKVTTMFSMFRDCNKLTSLDVSNFNTSNVADMSFMFFTCSGLTSLDVSNFNTSKVTNMQGMFTYCTKLTTLDVSNFSISNAANTAEMFLSTSLITDIGMIYCDKDTVSRVASLLPTDHNITIWVESDDILQYDQYDHITYKTQKVQDTVHLNSPLLMGDTIEVIDGKTYHVHRWEKIVLNGSEDWICYANGDITSVFCLKTLRGKLVEGINLYCDKFLGRFSSWYVDNRREGVQVDADIALVIQIDNSKLSTQDVNGFKQWLQQNSTTVICELTTPYYELISEEPLELTLVDTTSNTINNNSILPSNMTIANKELSTIAIKPSTIYTLSFDKSIEDSEVTIDICGGEQITTVLNRVELTTPSELGSGIRFISSDGCIISNVRLLEGSLVEKAIPRETFEGLQSSFDDGYIIGDFLGTANSMTLINTKNEIQASDDIIYLSKTIKANNPITLIFNTDIAHSNVRIGCYGNGIGSGFYSNIPKLDKIGFTKYLIIPSIDITVIRLVNQSSNSVKIGDMAKISNVVVLEGDHTHLSEAELMRYIEKGTSYYEEEDYNHVGKYKVEYKVTGKNKFDIDKCSFNTLDNGYTYMQHEINNKILLRKGVTYTLSYDCIVENPSNFTMNICHIPTHGLPDGTFYVPSSTGKKVCSFTPIETREYKILIYHNNGDTVGKYYVKPDSILLEEGSTPTEYEPYKEDIKTYYLSSPLLEGDTIEEINGVATHVKRYEKVVLDGSESWNLNADGKYYSYTDLLPKINIGHNKIISDKLPTIPSGWSTSILSISSHELWSYIYINNVPGIITVSDFKQWLSENPVTAIYELASPIYEPISTESILLDSYTNGHLDLSNENIPIQKTEFRNFTKELAYLQPSTDYVVRFSSDNIGIAKVYLDSSAKEINVVKGINEVIIATPSTIVNNNIIIDGIGFNVSNVQVIANAIKDGDIKDFDYFKGLQSSFESELITDENDENYGKYKVECKIVGKNKFDRELVNGSINNDFGELTFSTGALDSVVSVNPIKVMPETTYTISNDLNYSNYIYEYDFNMNYLNYYKFNDTSSFTTLNNTCYVRVRSIGSKMQNDLSVKYQLEEGTQATPYEPYKESIHTLYLNSPLLKGDKLVVHEGKLCHYHKMGMVVLDGSENWKVSADKQSLTNTIHFQLQNTQLTPIMKINSLLINNQFINHRIWEVDHEGTFCAINGNFGISILRSKLSTLDTDGFKQWLSKNPTTVVYELETPYYEPIEPQISQYSFSTVKDGDMEIITTLPIEIDLTYRTDINGVSSIEEQIASIQESTDISSIIDEEVDE